MTDAERYERLKAAGYPDIEIPGLGIVIEGQAERHQQAEGFKLMKYAVRLPDGQLEVEWIWNSRNAVAPFAVAHRDQKDNMQHIEWLSDPYLPLHIPNIGDRVVVSLTLDRALQYRKKFVAQYWNEPIETAGLRSQYESKDEAVEEMLSMCEDPDGARSRIVRSVDESWDPSSFSMSDQHESQSDAVRHYAESDIEQYGDQTPDIVVVDAELRDYFVSRVDAFLEHGITIPASPRITGRKR